MTLTTARPVLESTKAPAWLVWAAVGVLAISAGLLVGRSLTTSVIGYLLAPLVVTALVSFFRYKDVLASRSNVYTKSPGLQRTATITVIISFLVGIGHAWFIATDIAKALAA